MVSVRLAGAHCTIGQMSKSSYIKITCQALLSRARLRRKWIGSRHVSGLTVVGRKPISILPDCGRR